MLSLLTFWMHVAELGSFEIVVAAVSFELVAVDEMSSGFVSKGAFVIDAVLAAVIHVGHLFDIGHIHYEIVEVAFLALVVLSFELLLSVNKNLFVLML